MKSNSFILILSGISIIFIITSIIFVLYSNNKYEKLKIENENNKVFAEYYFELSKDSYYSNIGRGAYLLREWINENENRVVDASSFVLLQKKYNKFLDKLLTIFENKITFVKKDITYSTIDNDVSIILKSNGKYDVIADKCEEYDNNYKIINDEIVLIEIDSTNPYGWDILFLYKNQNILQSITWGGCDSTMLGSNLFSKY